jgi:hypothetical protein
VHQFQGRNQETLLGCEYRSLVDTIGDRFGYPNFTHYPAFGLACNFYDLDVYSA